MKITIMDWQVDDQCFETTFEQFVANAARAVQRVVEGFADEIQTEVKAYWTSKEASLFAGSAPARFTDDPR